MGEGRVIAFIDIGTNSIRLLVVRLNPNQSFTILTRQKQAVRLGEGEFETEEITADAMDRAILVARKFTELARSFGAGEFAVVATSATREAANQHLFLSRLRHEAGLDVRVISGKEEARLIYMGIASGTHLGESAALFIDIGGGSTELIVGGQRSYRVLESIRLGAIRLSNLFFGRDYTGPVPPELYRKMQAQVKAMAVHAVKRLRKAPFDLAIGSSGTIINLAEIAQRTGKRTGAGNGTVLAHKDLKRVAALLCEASLEQRRKIPGINPDRADIIVAGAAILDSLMEDLGIAGIAVTQRGLQEGLLADYLSRLDEYPLFGELSVRDQSVLQLGRSFGINEFHARTVTRLALELFDTARDVKLHSFGIWERELLEYATFLHDIGSFISYTNHHAHSYYIIRNTELLGFDQMEIEIMANIARYHRKKPPRRKHPEIWELEDRSRDTVRILSTFLRLAESLDRSHAGLVRKVRFRKADDRSAHLEIETQGDCQLEMWGVEYESRTFEKIIGRTLVLEVQRTGISPVVEGGGDLSGHER
jgi:exopolyphosphatase/guanosine-5'-triphosphate,3'-diphosphate pyrophosphatase